MFSDLLRRLTAPDPEPLPYDDARLALGALLVRIARSDGDYAGIEQAQIDRVLAHRYGLSDAEAAALRAESERLEAEAPDTVRFTRAIKDSVPYEDRVHVIEALWFIVLADGARDSEEDSLLRMIAPMLGVNDRDSNLARKRVEDAHYGD
ncbi:TerB family tellurite resistance protein [Roseicyclus persicicus]|uniref:TerB family tellurite resistance protein n=1 Tax=Roseicyclus persicicus TaxID=2650661 RepID=A0A7X6H036_9RHOB|nr:TerB family tellurite resistance protein [Roseibacterium persicicum]NKX44317.1 TerB family tellurite resistance protein [Roseibacterium persicicum]